MTVTATNPAQAFNDYIDVVRNCIQVNAGTSETLATASNSSNSSLVLLAQAWTTNTDETPVGSYAPPASGSGSFSEITNPVDAPVYTNPVAAALYGGYYYAGTTPFNEATQAEKIAGIFLPGASSSENTIYGLSPVSKGPQGFVANPYITYATNAPYSEGQAGASTVEGFISYYFGGGSANTYLNDLSSTMVLSVMGVLQNNWDPSSGSNSGTALGLCNSMNTLVSSAGTNAQQALQNICSALTNMLGQSQSALQTIVSGGSSVLQTVSSLVSAMSFY